jgi:hypothetical protein
MTTHSKKYRILLAFMLVAMLAMIFPVLASAASDADGDIITLHAEDMPDDYSTNPIYESNPVKPVTIAGGIWDYLNYTEYDGPSGTGVFNTYLKVGGKDVIQGFNTGGSVADYDEDDAWTMALPLTRVPLVKIDDTWYREFGVDLNQQKSSPLTEHISLEVMQIWRTTSSNLGGQYNMEPDFDFDTPGDPSQYVTTANPQIVYDMDGGFDPYNGSSITANNVTLVLDYAINNGSGKADNKLFVPAQWFGDNQGYAVMVVNHGTEGTVLDPEPPAGHPSDLPVVNNDGKEEWGVRVADFATKSGMKFNDLDADGIRDFIGGPTGHNSVDEPGLSGWTIYVDYNENYVLDAGEPSAVTDALGTYVIWNSINPGAWQVKEVPQAGWTNTLPAPLPGDEVGFYDEPFEAGDFITGNDFGNTQPVDIEASAEIQGVWEICTEWDIAKSVDEPEHHLFAGQTGTSNYTITLTKTTSGEVARVTGTVTVTNPGTVEAQGVGAVLTLSKVGAVGTMDTETLSIPNIAAGGSSGPISFMFDAVLFEAGATYRVDVAATASNGSSTDTANAFDETDSMQLVQSCEPDTINVNDTMFGDLGSFSSSTTLTADLSTLFDCDDEGENPNTATIVETDDQASALVTVYCYELVPDVRAGFTWGSEYEWTIDKTVTPDVWNLFEGDTGTSQYTVSVDKTFKEGSAVAKIDYRACVSNPAPMAATNVTLTATLYEVGNATSLASQVIFTGDVLAGGDSGCLDDFAFNDVPFTEGASYKIVISTVFTDGAAGDPTDPDDVETTVGPVTQTITGDTITVTDTNAGFGGPRQTSANASWTYDRTFDCEDEGENPNRATIVETDAYDDALVTVNCYELVVEKTAEACFTRTWDWTIDKTADTAGLLTLAEMEPYEVNYEVTVDATSTDSDWAVTGTITISNPAPMSAVINSIGDVISGLGAADVDFGVTFPYTLPAGKTLEGTYSADLPDAVARTNTATATQQNYAYDYVLPPVGNGTMEYSGAADVDFDGVEPCEEIDECIDLSDSEYGDLGTVCAGDAPKTITYSMSVNKEEYPCGGTNTLVNEACFVTNDSGATGCDAWTVSWIIPCPGCTLTQGYWKTHSTYGPAAHPDDTWGEVGGPDAAFFLSGQTWYEVFWTAPKGNAYYNLAHQYMAAVLNIENEASAPPAVNQAIADAGTLFEQYAPTDIAALKGNDPIRKQFLSLAGTLAQYNEGTIGPGHCDEDGYTNNGF